MSFVESSMQENNIHKNHRKRVFERGLKYGLESMTDVQLLESLLFYARPRVDTNPIAHALLEEFGSVRQVLQARTDELCRVDGVGETSAYLLRLITELMKRYEQEPIKKGTSFRELHQIGDYIHPYFIGLNVERLYLMMFNNRMNLIDCVLISEGVINCTDASLRKISEIVLNKGAAAVALAHNHPNGVAYPSAQDLSMTSTIEGFLRTINVTLLEHFVFNERRYYPIMKNHYSNFRASPITGEIENEFYDRFYRDVDGVCEVAPLFAENTEKST